MFLLLPHLFVGLAPVFVMGAWCAPNAISQVIANTRKPDIASDFSLISNRSGAHYTQKKACTKTVTQPSSQIKRKRYAFVLISNMSFKLGVKHC
ncbi:hypothetical protein [Pseudogulbenkiania sp. MAI-1]|uniref:hypothetical protein n=1 Tax=Pseudogulbenkiania sp. MAI-1 TaxID=990370 RepID=UPI0018DB6A8E|nr:hypothetical protein [Pseudogulbenkiania sp. MAI-1]